MRKLLIPGFLATVVLFSYFLVGSCYFGSSGDDDTSEDDAGGGGGDHHRPDTSNWWDSGDTDDDTDIPIPETWIDENTGLMWTTEGGFVDSFLRALIYCTELTTADQTDWRLPSISELRTLIRGCPSTETGSACRVSDECLTADCLDNACHDCPLLAGPGVGDIYWPDEFLDNNCCTYWSSSHVTDGVIGDVWFIRFSYGRIAHQPENMKFHARCVRNIDEKN